MNEELAKDFIMKAYRTIRIVKEIQRGNRSPVNIAKKTGYPLNLIHYYLDVLTKNI